MTNQLEEFQAKTRAWLRENYPPEVSTLPEGEGGTCWGGKRWSFAMPEQKLWMERMVAKGWTVPQWPREYGGAELSTAEAGILAKEMRRIRARSPLESLGIWMLGPALLKYGTDAQKARHLPGIARGEIRWAQGYSEPGAGSDLASVRSTAVEDGDDFIVNGTKLWTSYGDKCDWIFALVRTDPSASKHNGISFLLIDMESPGVAARPITLISGEAHFAETHFENVRVPKANLVGEVNRGWDVAKYLLGFERNSIGSLLGSPKESVLAAAQRALGAETLAQEHALHDEIIGHELNALAFNCSLERYGAQAAARQASPVGGSMLKVIATELEKRRTELLLASGGLDTLEKSSPGSFEWLQAMANTIGGGTTEIQLNIIAKRALGLPEE